MPDSNGKTIYDGLVARGFSPVQAAVITGNSQQESSFNPEAWNEASSAGGLMQWRESRLDGLLKYAEETGRKPNDIDTQLDYIVEEMAGPEAKSSAAFLSSPDIASANAAFKKYLRYGEAEGGRRLEYSQAFAGPQESNAAMSQTAINPAFRGEMPGAAVPPTQGTAPAQPNTPAGGNSGVSDADLLSMFLSPSASAAPASSTSQGSDDDAFLQQFLTQAPGAKADPLEGVTQLFPGADTISAFAGKTVHDLPIIGEPIYNALTDLKARIHGRTGEQQREIEQAIQDEQPVASTAGMVTGTVAPYLVGGAIPGVAKALGMSGNLLTRMVMGGLSSGAIEGADTLSRGGSVEDARNNALLAGAIGTGAAPIADVVGGAVNKLLSGTSEEVGKLAQLARDKFGIPIGPGQISENPMVRVADSAVSKLPLSGGVVSNEAQQTVFNKAVANTIGENAERLTPDVMSTAKARIGRDFDTVAQKTPSIAYDQPLDTALTQALNDAESVLQASEVAPLKKQVDAIIDKFSTGNNAITGEVYQALTRKGAPLDRLLSSTDPNIRYYAGQVREALDDAMARHAPADVKELLTQARSQWKAMRTIEGLAEKAPTGDISAPGLMQAVRGAYGDMAYGGGGDLAELARIGQRFLKAPPSSGTAERLAVLDLGKKMLGPAAVAGAAGTVAAIPQAIPAALAYSALVPAAGALLRSKALANKLIENSVGNATRGQGGVINRLTRSAVPLATPREPVTITVNGGNPLLAQ